MRDCGREIAQAYHDDPPPLDARHYREQSDVIARKGVEWVERCVEDWEYDHPGGIQ